MAYEMKGKVKLIQEKQVFGSGFEKREFVVTFEDGKYTQEINFECVGDRVDIISLFQVGSEITVGFDIRGREYNGRYFNNLVAWKIVGEKANSNAENPANTPTAPPVPESFDEYEDTIPF